jgi:hypothetical protein
MDQLPWDEPPFSNKKIPTDGGSKPWRLVSAREQTDGELPAHPKPNRTTSAFEQFALEVDVVIGRQEKAEARQTLLPTHAGANVSRGSSTLGDSCRITAFQGQGNCALIGIKPDALIGNSMRCF